MSLGFKNRLAAGVTVVSNEFIDRYLAEAGGEYVKVYLYLLRHEGEEVTVEMAAEALHHTEADVRRAIAYWEKVGVLVTGTAAKAAKTVSGAQTMGAAQAVGTEKTIKNAQYAPKSEMGEAQIGGSVRSPLSCASRETAASRAEGPAAGLAADLSRPCDMSRLDGDASFKQLVFITEQYLNKAGRMTATDCQILANLYSNLKMEPELLEYLMEYCAQNHHYSLRYAEKVALSWHEKRITTVEEAKAYSRGFSRESFAVMKAMGLSGRNPADAEYALMEKWFRQYGFTREIVVEACSRTIRAIHTPSFQYADKILTEWKEADVRTFSDIAALDKRRKEAAAAREQGAGCGGTGDGSGKDAGCGSWGAGKGSSGGNRQSGARGTSGSGTRRGGRSTNRFHNLEEHGYDYDEMVWNMINPGQETGGSDGAQ